MSEKLPGGENGKEKIHSREEVLEIFRGIIEGEFEVVRTLENEDGPYLIEAETKDKASGTVLYTYTRAGNFGNIFSTENDVIDVIFFVDGAPAGDTQFKYRNGQWEEVK